VPICSRSSDAMKGGRRPRPAVRAKVLALADKVIEQRPARRLRVTGCRLDHPSTTAGVSKIAADLLQRQVGTVGPQADSPVWA
jgi:hypothetical protein